MDLYEVMRCRRSIRGFKPDAIPTESLARMQEAVRLAPSACNRQPWKFLLVTSPEMRSRLGKLYSRDWLLQAPLVVVALGHREAAWKRFSGVSAHVIDVTIAMEHLVLAATAEGLGTCWICAFDQELAQQLLEVAPEWEVVAMTPVGFPNAAPRDVISKPLAEVFVNL